MIAPACAGPRSPCSSRSSPSRARRPPPRRPSPGTLVEKKVRSVAPRHREVRESLVRVYDPLPPEVGAHPPACDWIEYLRFRSADGPREAERRRRGDGDDPRLPRRRRLVRPGGAQHGRARRQARPRRRVLALDRRANCLEDDTRDPGRGAGGDATIAWDYYWGGEEVDGKTFAGFVSPQDAAFLGEFGLERTMGDWYRSCARGSRASRAARGR